MQVTLINPTPMDLFSPGVRVLAACLKRAGHRCRIIFLPGGVTAHRFGGKVAYQWPSEVLDQIAALCADSPLVGVSFMSPYFDRALQVTRHLRDHTDATVVWGGVHPTVKPDMSLEMCDAVCVGEGEEALVELADRLEAGRDFADVANIWTRHNSEIVRNDPRPINENLDSLPFPDHDLEDHYVLHPPADRIVRMTPELLRTGLPLGELPDGSLATAYRTSTSRGCPHDCAYCAVSSLKRMYRGLHGSRYLRWRSVENVIAELKWIRGRFPFIELIQFFDDTFFQRRRDDLAELCRRYKAEVGLPCYIQGSPTTVTAEKMDMCLDAGMVFLEVGVQTGCEATQRLYRRRVANDRVLRCARLIHGYRDRLMMPCYHIILDNPYEGDEGTRDTLDLLLRMPTPFFLKIASLCFYPGTGLYERAVEDGLIEDEFTEIYRKPFGIARGSYLNMLVYLTQLHEVPRGLIRWLARPFWTRLLDRRFLTPVYFRLYRVIEGLVRTRGVVRAFRQGRRERLLRVVRRALGRGKPGVAASAVRVPPEHPPVVPTPADNKPLVGSPS